MYTHAYAYARAHEREFDTHFDGDNGDTPMTGLLNKIRNEHTAPATKTPPTDDIATVDGNILDGKPIEPAAPCPTCHSPTFWRSAYGGELRCAVCDPWPSLAMVGERWTIYTRPDGSLVWVPCLRRGERARDPEPQSVVGPDNYERIRSQILDDEDGSWLVLWKTRAKT